MTPKQKQLFLEILDKATKNAGTIDTVEDACESLLSPSTGVCETPIQSFRSMSIEMFDKNISDWEPLTDESLLGILAFKLRRGILRGDIAKVTKDLLRDFAYESSISLEQASSDIVTGKSQATAAMVTTLYEDQQARDRDRRNYVRPQEIHKLQLLHFIDSGGQPQFHEVLPALSHNICLVMLFLKLNERLDAPSCTDFTDENGEWFEDQSLSLLTNEQMLVQLVHTIMSKPLSGEDTRAMVMVIGTHVDKIDECKDEGLADKNERLAILFNFVPDDQIIMNGNDIIFEVNALNPSEKDEQVFNLIRSKISQVSTALERNTPLSFIMFQYDLIKLRDEQHKRVVSMKECEAIAGRLKMDRRVLEAALFHFHSLSIFLYVPSILPGLVFIDPQMPLNIINQCVAFSYKVKRGKIIGLTPACICSWEEGIITSEMLEREEFASCFEPGVFDASDALKLFESLYIAVQLNSLSFLEGEKSEVGNVERRGGVEGGMRGTDEYSQLIDRSTEFMMPCMLPAMKLYEFKKYCPLPESISPLLLYLDKSQIPCGLFCATHTCLRSKYGWETYRKRKRKQRSHFMPQPECLYRNAVKLQHPSKPVQITFTYTPSHFSVHVNVPQSEIPAVCHEIRDMLLESVQSASHAFRYASPSVKIAFPCPCDPEHPEYLHPAIPTGDYLKCSDTGEISDPMTDYHRVWLDNTGTSEWRFSSQTVYMHE